MNFIWTASIRPADVLPPKLTATQLAELHLGVERMPQGQHKAVKRSMLEHVLSTGFGGYVLPFDEMAAAHFAYFMAHRIAIGVPISVQDGQIAANCRDHQATLATRNGRDFEHTGVALINPWDS